MNKVEVINAFREQANMLEGMDRLERMLSDTPKPKTRWVWNPTPTHFVCWFICGYLIWQAIRWAL